MFLLLSHYPDGGVSFLLSYGHPKDDPEAMDDPEAIHQKNPASNIIGVHGGQTV